MKYVIILDEFNLESPIIFSELRDYGQVVKNRDRVVSAGFCRFCVNRNNILKISCWGRSISLDTQSRGEVDEALLLKHNELYS